jgi:hypothetical protein
MSADQLVVKHLDVTGNGIDDEIRPNIKGENWNAQLNRTLTTAAQGKIIFKHSARPSSTRNLDTLTLSSS